MVLGGVVVVVRVVVVCQVHSNGQQQQKPLRQHLRGRERARTAAWLLILRAPVTLVCSALLWCPRCYGCASRRHPPAGEPAISAKSCKEEAARKTGPSSSSIRRRHRPYSFVPTHRRLPLSACFWWALLSALVGGRALVGAACVKTNCVGKPLWQCSLTDCTGQVYVRQRRRHRWCAVFVVRPGHRLVCLSLPSRCVAAHSRLMSAPPKLTTQEFGFTSVVGDAT